MGTPIFLRLSADKCRLYELGKDYEDYDDNDDNELDYEYVKHEDMEHGDIIYLPNSYRALKSYVYSKCGGGILKLASMGPGNGSGGIPAFISKYIENPIDFYKNVKVDLATIELDTKAHMSLLRNIAGDRDINLDIQFEYDCINEYITFRSAKLYNGDYHYELVLSPEIDSVYLTNKPFTDIDPISKRNIEKFIENYEKYSKEILQIDNNIWCEFKSSYINSSTSCTIKEIIYNKHNNPIKIICEETDIGIDGILDGEYVFRYSINKITKNPEWLCNNLKFENEEYKKEFNSYIFIISEINFRKKYNKKN